MNLRASTRGQFFFESFDEFRRIEGDSGISGSSFRRLTRLWVKPRNKTAVSLLRSTSAFKEQKSMYSSMGLSSHTLVFLNLAFCHRAQAFVHAKKIFGAGKFRNVLLSLRVYEINWLVHCITATTLPGGLGSGASDCATILNTHCECAFKMKKQ